MSEIIIPSSYELSLQAELRQSIEEWQKEVATLLPTLPPEVTIEFDNQHLTPGFGTGGVAWSPNVIKLAYDPTFCTNHKELMDELRATYFHEAYHLARGVSFESTPHDLPAINNAIEEGLATKFEVAHTNSKPGYEQYEDRETMLDWLKEVKGLPDGFDYE